MSHRRPPYVSRWIIGRLVAKGLRDDLLSDLDERFDRLVWQVGASGASRWYRSQLIRFVREMISSPRPPRARAEGEKTSRKRGSELMTGVWQDVRFAIRSLRRSPGFTLAALTVLTLGIGGTTAVFSVLNAVLLRPLPYAEPDALVVAWTVNMRQGLRDGTSQWNSRDWLERTRTLDDLTMFVRPEFTTATIADFGQPERVHVGIVDGRFFDVLGVTPLVGRTFRPDDVETDPNLVVLSEAYWHQHLAGSPDAIGSTIDVFGDPHRVVGVVSTDVRVPRATTMIWQLHDPYASEPGQYSRGNDAYVVLARLSDGSTVEAAQADLTRIAGELAEEYPQTNRYLGVEVNSLISEVTGERLPVVLWIVFSAVMVVLLIAATNVAHLILARGARRHRELALRSALGASRMRVVRQLVVETGVLGLLATVGGILLGAVALKAILTVVPPDVPRLDQVTLSGTVLFMAVAATAVVAPLFALVPSLSMSRQDPADALRHGGRGASGRDRGLRRVLVVAQVALAVVLLAEAGLLVRSARAVQSVDPGFDSRSVLVAQLDVGSDYENSEQVAQFVGAVRARLRQVPGVRGAGVIDDFFIQRFPDMGITAEGQPTRDPNEPAPRLTGDGVYPGFFEALGVSILAGRAFELADIPAEGQARTAIVNLSMAEAFWPGESPVGRRFWWGDQDEGDPGITVVGVVPDMRRGALEEASYPHVFLPGVSRSMDLVVRTSGDPLAIAESVRRVVADVDVTVPVSRLGTAWSRFGDSMADRRLQSWLLGIFSGLAVLLAAIGLYALLYDAVTARRREIGIRIALGAGPNSVRTLILREGLALAGVGLVVGLVGAVAASRLTESMLYGVGSGDPITLLVVSVGLLAVAAAASWIPARRATFLEPTQTLATE